MFGVGELETVLLEKDIPFDPLILHLESLSNLLSIHFHQNSILIIYNLGKPSSWSICATVFTQSYGHLCGSVGLCLLQKSILSHLFWISEYFYHPSLVPNFFRVILSPNTFSFMLVTTRYQVDQGKQPQVFFKQLPLVQTCRRRKRKKPMSIQSPENISEALFDPGSDLIELSTPLASPHSDMDMNFTMGSQKKNQSSEYYVELLSGDPSH